MKKLFILIIVILLCVAGWAGATYFASVKVEDEYNKFIEKYARLGPITLASQNSQRGFLSSKVETVLELTMPKVPTTPVEPSESPAMPEFETVQLVLGHDIYHGPLPVGANGSAAPALALIDTRIVSVSGNEIDFDAFLQQVPELRDSFSRTRVNLDGSSRGELEIPPFTKQNEHGTFTWGGLTATTDYDPGPGTLVGQFDMPNMDMSFENGAVQWKGFHYDFDLVEALPMLYVGPGKMVLGSMSMNTVDKKSGNAKSMVTDEVRITSETSYVDGMVNGRQTMMFDGASLDGVTYGPLEFDLELKNMDGQALSDYQQNILAIYGEMSEIDPQAMFARLMPVYTDLILRLMAGSPEFNINRFYVNTPMGEASGEILIKYENPDQEAPTDLAMLPQYLPFLDADANLAVDKGVALTFLKSSVEKQFKAAIASGNQPEMSKLEMDALVNQQVEMQLQMFAAQGFITQDGEKVKSHITFSGGELKVNGNPLPIFGQN